VTLLVRVGKDRNLGRVRDRFLIQEGLVLILVGGSGGWSCGSGIQGGNRKTFQKGEGGSEKVCGAWGDDLVVVKHYDGYRVSKQGVL